MLKITGKTIQIKKEEQKKKKREINNNNNNNQNKDKKDRVRDYHHYSKSKVTSKKEAMVYVLVLGDIHIPTRAHQVPEKIKEVLLKSKDIIQTIISTGNICGRESYDFIRTISNDIQSVRGDLDGGIGANFSASYPETKIITIEGVKIGVCHGHQVVPWGDHDSLQGLQRRLNCDVLITGHTHVPEIFKSDDDKLFINPGSLTGAYSPINPVSIPSFVLLEIKGDGKITCFFYKLVDDNIVVEKNVFENVKH